MAAKIRSIRGPKKSALKSVAELAKIPESGLSRKRGGKPKRTLRTAVEEIMIALVKSEEAYLILRRSDEAALCSIVRSFLRGALENPDV